VLCSSVSVTGVMSSVIQEDVKVDSIPEEVEVSEEVTWDVPKVSIRRVLQYSYCNWYWILLGTCAALVQGSAMPLFGLTLT